METTPDERFLRSLLNSQNLSSTQKLNLTKQRRAVKSIIEAKFEKNLRYFSVGSKKRKTIIGEVCDYDLVLCWHQTSELSIQSIYKAIGVELQNKWKKVRSKGITWKVPFSKSFHVDVIPAKAIDDDYNMMEVYNSDLEKPIKTSFSVHIKVLQKQFAGQIVRLLKIWKVKKMVPIKTFVLEQLVVQSLQNSTGEPLEVKLELALNKIELIEELEVRDPANSENIISNDMTSAEKREVKKQCQIALNQLPDWLKLF